MLKINCRAWFRKPNGEKAVVMVTGINDGHYQIVGNNIFITARPDQLEEIDTESPISNECYKCGKEATLLCDGWVRNFKKTKPKPVGEMNETCDRPMCEECAHVDSPIFFSGKDGGVVFNHYCNRCNPLKHLLPRQ